MKKKVIMMSAVALLTANALTFGPVSYKVVDKAYAASESVEQAARGLSNVYAEIKSEPKLVDAVNAAWTGTDAVVADFDISAYLPELTANLNDQLAGSADTVETLIKSISQQILFKLNLDNAPFVGGLNIQTEIDAVNTQFGVSLTKEDIADFVVVVESKFTSNLSGLILTSSTLQEVILEKVEEAVTDQWAVGTPNAVVAFVKAQYNGELPKFESDIATAKVQLGLYFEGITQGEKDVLKTGAIAFGVGYAKYALKKTPALAEPSKPGSGKYVFNTVNFLGTTLPLSEFVWETTEGTIGLNTSGKLTLDLSSVGGTYPKTVIISAKLGTGALIPTDFQGINILSQTFTVTPSISDTSGGGGGGGIVETGPLQLVTDAFAIADAIDTKVEELLAGNVDLTTNKGVAELQTLIEDQLRDALTVPVASKLTAVNGVSTLDLTVEDLDYIFTEQLNHVLTQAIGAYEDATGSKDINSVITFDLGASVTDSNVKLSAQVISTLEAKGITTVAVKVGGAIVEVPLAELVGASSIVVTKSADEVTGLQAGAKQLSSIYSVQILDANGAEIAAFPGQYRLGLGVNVAGVTDTSRLAIAKVTDNSITLVGGNYNEDSNQVDAYRSGFSNYVVLENNVSFNDTAALAWAEGDIELAAAKGIILGKAEGIFDPRSNVTRAEFTAMVVRALGVESDTHSENFTDVIDAAWYQSVVASATAHGIINGRTSTTFDPNANVTREEMATITANALQSVLGYNAANSADALANFTDAASFAEVHKAGIALVAQEGIVQGKGNGVYDPKGTATRAEAAVIIAKLIKLR